MNNLDELKQIWMSTGLEKLPKSGEILKAIKRHHRKEALKKVLLILFTLLLVLTMCWVVFDYKSRLLSTRIGEVFMFIAMFILLSSNAISLVKMSARLQYSNEEYINFLKQKQLQRYRRTEKTQLIGFLFASAGLLLYLFEGVYRNTTLLATGYILTIAWINCSWFILRPLALRRKTRKLNETVSNLERLSAQLENQN
jgi:hypothetical protein